MNHAHHWLIEGAEPEADGICKTCGERRHFSGGVALRYGFEEWQYARLVSLDRLIRRSHGDDYELDID